MMFIIALLVLGHICFHGQASHFGDEHGMFAKMKITGHDLHRNSKDSQDIKSYHVESQKGKSPSLKLTHKSLSKQHVGKFLTIEEETVKNGIELATEPGAPAGGYYAPASPADYYGYYYDDYFNYYDDYFFDDYYAYDDSFAGSYYDDSHVFEEGWGILQYYSGSLCNGSLTQNYGYKNGACIPNGYYNSLRMDLNSSDCSSSLVRYYYDDACRYHWYTIRVGEQTLCTKEPPAANSDYSSVNFVCVFQSDVPVLMDGLMFTYRGGFTDDNVAGGCSSEVLSFESARTGSCLANPFFGYSIEATCEDDGSSYTVNKYEGTDSATETCSNDPVRSTSESTICPADGYPSTSIRRSLRGKGRKPSPLAPNKKKAMQHLAKQHNEKSVEVDHHHHDANGGPSKGLRKPGPRSHREGHEQLKKQNGHRKQYHKHHEGENHGEEKQLDEIGDHHHGHHQNYEQRKSHKNAPRKQGPHSKQSPAHHRDHAPHKDGPSHNQAPHKQAPHHKQASKQHPKQAPRHHRREHADRSHHEEHTDIHLVESTLENSKSEHRHHQHGEENYHGHKHMAKMTKEEEIKHYAMKEKIAQESLKYHSSEATAVIDTKEKKEHKHHHDEHHKRVAKMSQEEEEIEDFAMKERLARESLKQHDVSETIVHTDKVKVVKEDNKHKHSKEHRGHHELTAKMTKEEEIKHYAMKDRIARESVKVEAGETVAETLDAVKVHHIMKGHLYDNNKGAEMETLTTKQHVEAETTAVVISDIKAVNGIETEALPNPQTVDPSRRPSEAPSSAPTTTVGSCSGFYSATNTNSAQQNTVNCHFTACSNLKVVITTCGACTSDTYLRLFNATSGVQLAYNDDACGLCSKIDFYTGDTGCQRYSIHKGCYLSGSCTATVSVTTSVVERGHYFYDDNYYDDNSGYYGYYGNYGYNNYYYYEPALVPSPMPTHRPTQVSAAPTAVVSSCSGYYTATNTASATQNTANCTFTACSDEKIVISSCASGACSSDTYFRLYNTSSGLELAYNDDSCGFCSKIVYYTQNSNCQSYTLYKGCYSSESCAADVSVTTSVTDQYYDDYSYSSYSYSYSYYPPAIAPSRYPSQLPSLRPTQVSAAPTGVVASTCGGYFSATNTLSATQNTVNCTLTACADQKLVITTCGQCHTDTYLRLYNTSSDLQVAYNDDTCGLCSKIVYFTNNNSCQSYTLAQGCFSTESCSANVSIYYTEVVDDYISNDQYYQYYDDFTGYYDDNYFYHNYYSYNDYFSYNDYYSNYNYYSSNYYDNYNNYGYYYGLDSEIYTHSQCVGQNYTLPAYVGPTAMPTASPSVLPTILPTARPSIVIPTKTPTVAPSTLTRTPTVAPASVSFAVVQTISGISYTTYTSDPSYETTLTTSIAACMDDVTASDIIDLVVTDGSTSSSVSVMLLSVQVKKQKKHIAATTDSIVASYVVSVASTTSTYDSLVSQLNAAVSGTTFTNYLTTYSAVYSTPGFSNCTSVVQSTTDTSSTGSTSTSAAVLSMGAIIGIAVGGAALMCCCAIALYFLVCNKAYSANDNGGGFADELEMGSTKNPSAPAVESPNSSRKMNRPASNRNVGESASRYSTGGRKPSISGEDSFYMENPSSRLSAGESGDNRAKSAGRARPATSPTRNNATEGRRPLSTGRSGRKKSAKMDAEERADL